jgi:hypothetical protein
MEENLPLILIIGGAIAAGICGFNLLITILSLLPFGLVGGHLLRRYRAASAMRQASQHWPTTTGEVLKSRVEVQGGSSTSVTPRVMYEYMVGGRQYQNDQIRAGDSFLAIYRSRQAYQAIDRYPEGTGVTVYYNPENPAESALER